MASLLFNRLCRLHRGTLSCLVLSPKKRIVELNDGRHVLLCRPPLGTTLTLLYTKKPLEPWSPNGFLTVII